MTSDVKFLVTAALAVHGLGHGGALGALLWIRFRPEDNSGAWLAARSWLMPALPGSTATMIASAFWILAMVGFLAAVLSFWGIALSSAIWGPLAIVSAFISLTGIVLFFGTWPMFNTLAAITVNGAVLVTQLWTHWPQSAVLGR